MSMRRASTIVIGFLMAAGVALSGPGASAAPVATPPATDVVAPLSAANRIVQGDGVVHDDLADEATLCNGCAYWNGNYAGFWQAILWADGFLSDSQVDCEFGPITATATRNWQKRFGLQDDGIVGPRTRGLVDDWLFESGGFVIYPGLDDRRIAFIRDWASPYNYHMFWNNQWVTLQYNVKSIPGC
jgi:hypothetical protein